MDNKEVVRRCSNPRCQHVLTLADEEQGRCPLCRTIILTLRPAEAFRVAFCTREESKQ